MDGYTNLAVYLEKIIGRNLHPNSLKTYVITTVVSIFLPTVDDSVHLVQDSSGNVLWH